MRQREALNLVARSFYERGWLLVAFLPLTQIMGRAVFNVAGSLLLLWGLSGLLAFRPRLDRKLLGLYVMTLASFTCSAVLASDSAEAFRKLFIFVLYSLLPWLVYSAIRSAKDIQRLATAFAWSGALSMLLLWIRYAYQFHADSFVPELRMREDNLPFLLPFLLYTIMEHKRFRHRHIAALGATSVFATYIILSNGRSALLALLLSILVYGFLAIEIRKRVAVLVVIAVVVSAWALRGQHLIRNAQRESDLSSALNIVSSFRIELWQNALNHPPENLWFGSGMGNIPGEVLTVQGATAPNLKHLHNFLLDCGYENGIIGLFLTLCMIAYLLALAASSWRHGSPCDRRLLGTLLSAAAAILVGASLSYSYTSKQFAIYLLTIAFAAVAYQTLDSLAPPGVQPKTRPHS
jgi:teichuronic acid biosynthesis protein TuaE